MLFIPSTCSHIVEYHMFHSQMLSLELWFSFDSLCWILQMNIVWKRVVTILSIVLATFTTSSTMVIYNKWLLRLEKFSYYELTSDNIVVTAVWNKALVTTGKNSSFSKV